VARRRAVDKDAAMSWNNRVIWSEGLFLRPQHFQQSDRYFEKLVRSRAGALRPYPWGVTELRINRDMLGLGKFAIEEARGVLEDGTPFSIPDDADHPPPLDIPENTRNAIVYLALPGYQPGALESAPPDAIDSVARFAVQEQEISDATAPGRPNVGIEIGRLRLRFVLEGADRAGLICLGLARITEIRSDKQIQLDDRFIAPTLDCASSKILAGFIAEFQGLLHSRGEALGGRLGDSGAKGVAEVSDVLMLQVVNRFEPLFAHFATAQHVHPETFYTTCLQLTGELATFASRSKRPPDFPRYRHDDLAASFAPVVATLRDYLSKVDDRTAVAITLHPRRFGVFVAVIEDKTMITSAAFVLSVKADIEAEQIRRAFPGRSKLGPVESIRDLVQNALPGIPLRPLPVVPRQIPFHVGRVYFELDRTGPYWKALQTAGGLAIHVADGFPNLEMELWAIRGQ
jgi:type VI secretion system protein ImpJ